MTANADNVRALLVNFKILCRIEVFLKHKNFTPLSRSFIEYE